jgi:DNA-binding XRE family transcriptional regulator
VTIVDHQTVDCQHVDWQSVDRGGVIREAAANMSASLSQQEFRARLAKNIRQHRASMGVSQEGLADLAGVHRTFVSQIERGLRNMSLDVILKLANSLKVDPVDLFKP